MKVSDLVKKEPPKGVKKYIGKKLYKLHITKFFGYFSGRYFVEVRCDCGTEKILNVSNLIWGTTRSCGCLLNSYNQYRKINKTQKVFK